MMYDKLVYYWLHISKVSNLRANKILEIYKPQELFSIIEKEQKISALLGEESYDLLLKNRNFDYLNTEVDKLFRRGINILTPCDAEFASRLLEREVNPPIFLYYVGDLNLFSTTCISIVGTRHCSRYGKEVTQKFTRELVGYNFTIVSGLATGVDAYAHETALKEGGKTIAVLGNGFEKFYPTANYALFEKIKQQGLVISEYEPSFSGSKYSFPERNRLIAALGEITIVAEAGIKSGACITADRANEQGKTVFAIPGNISSSQSIGTNNLIKEGASILTETQDILRFFDISNTKIKKNNAVIKLDFYEEKIYTLLQNEGKNFEELKNIAGFTVSELVSILLSLEMKNLIIRGHNNFYTINGEN